MVGYHPKARIRSGVTCSAWQRASLYQPGELMDGLPLQPVEGVRTIIIGVHWEILTEIPMNAAGFSGIVGTGWDGGFRGSMTFRSGDGGPFGGTRAPCAAAVHLGLVTKRVGSESARRSFSGLTILLFEQDYNPFI